MNTCNAHATEILEFLRTIWAKPNTLKKKTTKGDFEKKFQRVILNAALFVLANKAYFL